MKRQYSCAKCKGKVTSNTTTTKEGNRGLGTWHCSNGCYPTKVVVKLIKDEPDV